MKKLNTTILNLHDMAYNKKIISTWRYHPQSGLEKHFFKFNIFTGQEIQENYLFLRYRWMCK